VGSSCWGCHKADRPGCDVELNKCGGYLQGVDDTRDVTKNGQQNVDEEVGAATTLEENTHGGKDDGKKDLAEIARDVLDDPQRPETQKKEKRGEGRVYANPELPPEGREGRDSWMLGLPGSERHYE
jgi:hypothetical protein